MSEQIVRKCDECGALHGEVNNWWCAVNAPGAPMFVTYEVADDMRAARERAEEQFRFDYCSHKCVGTAFHRWLDTGDVRELKPVIKVDAEEMDESAVLV